MCLHFLLLFVSIPESCIILSWSFVIVFYRLFRVISLWFVVWSLLFTQFPLQSPIVYNKTLFTFAFICFYILYIVFVTKSSFKNRRLEYNFSFLQSLIIRSEGGILWCFSRLIQVLFIFLPLLAVFNYCKFSLFVTPLLCQLVRFSTKKLF